MIASLHQLAVVPILVGPLQVLLAMLPAILFGIGSALLALFKPATFKLALRLLWRVKISLLVAITILTGTVFAARTVWRGAGAIREAEAGARDWPLFRGNARRTGAAESGGAPLVGGRNWAFASEAKTFHSSPTIVGNRVYATSAEVGVFSNRGAVYCLDADTGGVVWKSAPDGMRATFSSPSVSGKYLVTGEGLHQVRDGRITCLDVTRGGAVLWSFRTKGHVESSAAIADGRAIIGAGDDGYYCLRLEPDAQGKPVLLWHLTGDQYRDAENDAVIHEGRAYLGLGMGGNAVVCVDAATGRELWRVATPAPVFSPPSVARGKLFIGMGHGNFVESEEQVIAAELERLRAAGNSAAEIESAKTHLQPGGEAWCIDLATHQVEWRFMADSTVLGAIVAAEDRLFLASRGGTVYSLGFDGKLLATWNARAPIIASLAATASHVYAVTESGLLFALEQSNLQPVWETRLGSAGTFLSSPAIARGHVYAGSPEEGLLCVGRPRGEANNRIWAGELGGAGVGGNPENAALPSEGEVLWSSGSPDDESNPPAAVLGNMVFQSAGFRGGLIRFDVQDEALVERWHFRTDHLIRRSPAAAGEIVAFSEVNGPGPGRKLHVLSIADGKERWSVPIGAGLEADAYGLATMTAEAIIVEEQPGWLSSYEHGGRLRWRQPYSLASQEQLAGVPALRDSLIVVAGHHCLTVLDELSGATLWTQPVEYPSAGPVLHGNSILLPIDNGVGAYRLIDGKALYHLPSTGDLSGLVRVGELLAGTNAAGELIIIDPVAGKLVARKAAGGIPQYPPLPEPNGLLFVTKAGLARFQLDAESITPWLSLDRGRGEFINSSPVVVGSSVCFSSNLRFMRAGKRP